MNKNIIHTAIIREDLLSISEFSRRYKVSRKKVYALIAENLLNTEIICSQTFINISDKAILDNAMGFRTQNPGQWSRNHPYVPYMPKSEQDSEFERSWRESQGMK